MATVRAKVDCYLASAHGGFKHKGDVFEYDGPPNENLDSLEPTAAETFAKFMMETSGGFHSSEEDWTTVGIDATGFPVPKGSPEDVSGKPKPPARRCGTPGA